MTGICVDRVMVHDERFDEMYATASSAMTTPPRMTSTRDPSASPALVPASRYTEPPVRYVTVVQPTRVESAVRVDCAAASAVATVIATTTSVRQVAGAITASCPVDGTSSRSALSYR